MEIDFNQHIENIVTGTKALSYSSLSAFLKSPKHFKRYVTEPVVTEAMEQGKRFHMAVLEPEKFQSLYWCLDDTEKVNELVNNGSKNARATKEYKEWVLAQGLLNEGKEMIKKDEYDLYLKMAESLRENPASKDLINNIINKEQFHKLEYGGFNFNMVMDGEGEDYIIDLKKVADASLKKVKWTIQDNNYDLQAAIYTKKIKKPYWLIFIDGDCNILVVKLSESTIEAGQDKLDLAVDKFGECAECDLWNCSYDFWNGGFVQL